MKERDRKYIEEITKQLGQMPYKFNASVVIELRRIIDHLNAENKKLKADLDRAVNALVKS